MKEGELKSIEEEKDNKWKIGEGYKFELVEREEMEEGGDNNP